MQLVEHALESVGGYLQNLIFGQAQALFGRQRPSTIWRGASCHFPIQRQICMATFPKVLLSFFLSFPINFV